MEVWGLLRTAPSSDKNSSSLSCSRLSVAKWRKKMKKERFGTAVMSRYRVKTSRRVTDDGIWSGRDWSADLDMNWPEKEWFWIHTWKVMFNFVQLISNIWEASGSQKWFHICSRNMGMYNCNISWLVSAMNDDSEGRAYKTNAYWISSSNANSKFRTSWCQSGAVVRLFRTTVARWYCSSRSNGSSTSFRVDVGTRATRAGGRLFVGRSSMPSGSGNKWRSTSDRFSSHGTKAPSGLQTLLVESRYTSEMFKPEMVLLVTFTPVGDFTGTKAG